MEVTLKPKERGIFEHHPPECQESRNSKASPESKDECRKCAGVEKIYYACADPSHEGPQTFLSIPPGRNVFNNKQTTDSIETLGQINMSWSELRLFNAKVVFLCAKWPILSSILLVIVELLLSRVLSYIIDSAVRSSTLSNPLVGFIILVDLVFNLLSLDRSLRKIYCSPTWTPFSIAARCTGGNVLRSLPGIRV